MNDSRDALDAVYATLDDLLQFAADRLGLDPRDLAWTRNRLLDELDLPSYRHVGVDGQPAGHADATGSSAGPDELADRLWHAMVAAGLAGETAADNATPGRWTKQSLTDVVFGILSLPPSALDDRFAAVEADRGAMAAMDMLYRYSVDNTYVKLAQLERNPRFDSHGLTITINLAKPEFKTMKSAAAGNAVGDGYPACTICRDNEGFAGRDKRTLRTVPVTLDGNPWFWQFSPYGYFHQHGICVNDDHVPMHVDRRTFARLLDFVDRFPGYFLGCNAALPRIGGSVLAHDHYQGGGEPLPMFRAATTGTYRPGTCRPATSAGEDVPRNGDPAGGAASDSAVVVETLDWPGTAVRVVSRSRDAVVETAETIRQGWVAYDNPAIGILHADADGPRSAVSPSVLKTSRGYEMMLIFRNNAVSDEYPLGVFHAHPEYWPVKQEPIGLIEAQGLFVLPGRLVEQLGILEDALVTGGLLAELPEPVGEFTLVWTEVRDRLATAGSFDRPAVRAALRDELGAVCYRILENTAVFKTPELMDGFLRSLGFVGGEAGNMNDSCDDGKPGEGAGRTVDDDPDNERGPR
ncbi:galactose-1-phosphate uridylyltransferase [Bifidobacterium choloepi]|uniref:galactose-1-phosphate uridylyltransferase n=1 Tax=Bifidobacterium choloepi TaxID=2614131 RepID=UPI001E62F8A2|nr:galactose-1-phosphate uridylyltransferase [Bifidobacterium choloepi]